MSVNIANRTYELACGDGEEERVQELAAYVEEKVTELRQQLLPGTPEVKLLVFAAADAWPRKAAKRAASPKQAETARAPAPPTAPRRWRPRSRSSITSRVDKLAARRPARRRRVWG